MQNKIKKQKNTGYTIIETMISISIFLILIMTGMTSLLNASLVHQKSQDMRSTMDNLSFIMEDVSRNLRTGSQYHCILFGDLSSLNSKQSGQDCTGIAFLASDNINRWVYNVDDNGAIQKSIDGGSTYTQLTPDTVKVNSSVFSVFGAEAPTSDKQQPLVIIKLIGNITTKGVVVSPFSLETMVSERLLDI